MYGAMKKKTMKTNKMNNRMENKKMKTFHGILAILIAGAISASTASAATIVAYYKINDGNDETIGSSDSDGFSTAGNHVLLDAINDSGVGTNWNATYEALGATDSSGSGYRSDTLMRESNYAAALAGGDYNTFSLTVLADNLLDLDTYAFHYGNADGNAADSFQLAYSLDGTNFSTVGSVVSAPQSGLSFYEVDLSSLATIDGGTTGTTIDFRLVGWGGAQNGDIRWGEQALVGTYVIPEPASLSLLGLLAGLTLRRRRK